jgi:mannose-6-phosphate isomerase-like protein (cupin superfamily)
MSSHIVKKADDHDYQVPTEFQERRRGYSGDRIVNEAAGAVQMGFQISRLDPEGRVAHHLHSFEETIYVIDGNLVVDLPEGSFAVGAGDYGLIPLGVTHSLRNMSATTANFVEMRAPLPREQHEFDTYFPEPLPVGGVTPIDVRDPRNRSFGHIEPENMDPSMQTQDRLAMSASMRTALLVYSGISVKMMIDSDLGADLSTMFMVQYVPGGFAGAHDHPLEEAYLILEGEVVAAFDGVEYHLVPGDVAWAGVGCVHEFRNVGEGRVRWLETQAPQPPSRHSYRFRRDWAYLTEALAASD